MTDPADATARAAALDALGCPEGPISFDGLTAQHLAERFGTPLYVHSATALRQRIHSLRRAFGNEVDLLYALKANPLAALVQRAHAKGLGAELASEGELEVALRVGVPGRRMQFAGPGKSEADLRRAIEVGACLNLESESEAERVRTIAAILGRPARVQIRVNPMRPTSGARLRMADVSSRFGIDRPRVGPLAKQLDEASEIELLGLHVYGGSQTFDGSSWLEAARDVDALANDIQTEQGVRLRQLNLGGGFGWPVYDGDPQFDLEDTGARFREFEASTDRALTIELGRYLCAGGGVYLTRVIDLKRSGNRMHAVLDGGLHQCAAASGFGASLRRAYAVVRADDPNPTEKQTMSLGGPLCTPADRLGRDLRIAPLDVGDIVAVLNVGAYGLTFSPTEFLSHARPAEVVVDEGQARLARRRGTPEDALRDQLLDAPPNPNPS